MAGDSRRGIALGVLLVGTPMDLLDATVLTLPCRLCSATSARTTARRSGS